MRTRHQERRAAVVALLALAACSNSVSVTLTPSAAVVPTGGTQTFTASVTGASNSAVGWSATGGTIDGTGRSVTYSAQLVGGVFEVTATSLADTTKAATAAVTVTAGATLWTRQFGTGGDDVVWAVAVDAAGNVFAAGSTSGDLQGNGSAGFRDAFLRKVDAQGNEVWTRQFGTGGNDDAFAVAVDAAGNAVVAGATRGALEGTNKGGQDAFVRRYDANGNEGWTRQFGTDNLDEALGVALDGAGNVVVVGTTRGNLAGTSEGLDDAFARMYDANGTEVWTRRFGTARYDNAWGVAFDGSGFAYVVGGTGGDLAGDNAGSLDAFVRKIDPSGNERWTRQFGTDGADYLNGVAVDGAGFVFVAGTTTGRLAGANQGDFDAFVRKLDANGNESWTRQFGSAGPEDAVAVATDAAGNVLVAGYTFGSLEGNTSGGYDAFVRKLDGGGGEVWTRQIGTGGDDYAYGVAVGAGGRVVVGGRTGGDLAGNLGGGSDGFVRVLSP